MSNLPPEPLLERVFASIDSNGKSQSVSLKVWKPYAVPGTVDNPTWRCPFQITGLGSDTVKEIPGIDTLDALLMALRMAEARIISDSQTYGKRIFWQNEEELGMLNPSPSQLEQVSADDSVFKIAFDEFFRSLDSKDNHA
jgi:hypothetical protein